METTRLLWGCALLIGLQGAHAQGAASNWPQRPVRIIVGFSAGSATDMSARMVGPRLSELWKQPVVIENRPGAGSSVANALAAKAAPDGYTLLMVSTAFAINAVLQDKPPYDPVKDFTGVTQVGFSTGVLVASPTLGAKTLPDLIAAANARPGKVLFGSAGAGSGIHMSTVRFNMAAGIKTTHVAFKGQPEMLIEIIAGRVHYGIPGLGPALPMIKDGRDVATVLDMPEVRKQMEVMDFVPGPTTPEEYTRIVHNQLKIFDAVARQAGLKAN